jgi:hypothetical protein
VHREQPLVAVDGREADRVQAEALAVPALPHDLAGQRQHPQRRVPAVAVLGVLDADQLLVADSPPTLASCSVA